ncbi:MAG TPA: ATP-binding protein [Thermomicrobiales bacterium]|nr:ATP-binding protein [Thermomicrobiales bacterium]
MFTSVGRRLALLNAAVVVIVIAIVGIATVLLLRASLDREASHALKDQAEAAAERWSTVFTTGGATAPTATSTSTSSNAEDAEDDDIKDIFKRGDTLLYAIAPDGSVLINDRELNIPGLPAKAGLAAALKGDSDTRIIRIDGQPVRVFTEPVDVHHRVIGAVQAVRGEQEHEQELRLVQMVALAGAGLGVLIAVPAGLFLSRRAMRPIDAAFRRQRTFVTDASHELRTPLTLIRANVELAQRLQDTPPSTAAELENILDEIDRMTRLVNDLLLLSRATEDTTPLPHVSVDLQAMAQKTVASMREKGRTLGVALSLEGGEDLVVRGDPDRLFEALQAILNNAITYTPRGGSVRVSLKRHGQQAVMTVADTGIGIAPDDQRRVFDRFYRADAARGRATGGTGLGLTIAKAIIEAHGGTIELTSTPGTGTEVRFTLPLLHAREGDRNQQLAARGQPANRR